MITHPSPYEHLLVGSFFELPIMYFLENITDLDNMIINKNNYLLPADEDLEEQTMAIKDTSKLQTGEQGTPVELDKSLSTYAGCGTKKKALSIGEESSHVGFTQLIYVNENRPFRKTDMHHSYSEVSRKRMLMSQSGLSEMCLKLLNGVDPDLKSDETDKQSRSNQLLLWSDLLVETATRLLEPFLSSFEDLTMDWVDCVQCRFWPKDAEEWIRRERLHGWPPPNIVDMIIKDGCFLVSKPHQNQPGAEEFRYSFSKAELILIHSWNNVQKHIYHILRLVKKDVSKKCGKKDECPLKTYHVKTLMLWACEEKPPDFWEIGSLAASLETLLCTIIEWLIEKDCRNYFISSYNLWDYLPQGWNCEKEVRGILCAIENIQMHIGKTARLFETFSDHEDNKMHFLVPNKLVFIIQMRFFYGHVLNLTLSGSQRYMVGNAFEQSDFIRSKFSYLYDIMAKQVEYHSKNQEGNNLTAIASNSEVLYRRSEETDIFNDNHERDLKIELADDILNSIRHLRDVSLEGFTEMTISPRDNGHELIKRILDTSIDHKCQHDIDLRQKFHQNIMINFWRLEPLMLPLIQYLNDGTVHPFLILSYAYEANFHYTGFADCPDFSDHCLLALDLCKKGLELCTKLSKEDIFWISAAPELFPVLVTRRWLSIFDRYIIAALKLYLSTSDELETKDFVVRFSVQPFLKYVGLQCSRIIGNSLYEETVLNSFAYEPDPNPTTGILWTALDGSKA